MTERYILDTAGEIIDLHTNKWIDYGEEICNLLNEQYHRIRTLEKQLASEHQMLDNSILLERTRMGQNALKQYREAIQ